MKIFCYIGWHCWHVSPNGMIRYCPNCSSWEVNHNLSSDPIKKWRHIDWEEKNKLTDTWYQAGKLL